MGQDCCAPEAGAAGDATYRRVLWIALLVNGGMFFVEIVASFFSGSVSLQADALDFFGDAANYGISLFVLSMSLRARASAALFKAGCMAVFGLFVLGHAGYRAVAGIVPDAGTMGIIGVVALAANVGVAVLLFRFRSGDANMRSVWLCSRNDALGNIAVILAAGGVFATSTRWPDLAVAVLVAGLAISAAWHVGRVALQERRRPHPEFATG